MDGPGLTRRDAMASVALTVGACTILAGCEATKKEEKPALITTGTLVLGPATLYPAGSANVSFLETHGIVVVNESGTPMVIRPKCTHLGCTVNWNVKTDQFVCPCHDSHFDLLGQAIKGPATKPLPAVRAMRNSAGELFVDLDKLYSL